MGGVGLLDIVVDIGEIIRQRRKQLGVTQTELACRLGISRNQVSNLETGKSLPSSKVMASLEEALETSFAELLSSDDPSPVVWLTRSRASSDHAAEARGRQRGVDEERLAGGPGQRLSPVRVRLAPRTRWEAGPHMQERSEHFVYVVSGVVEGLADGRWLTLGRRHAMYIRGQGPAVWRNPGEETAVMLWIGGE